MKHQPFTGDVDETLVTEIRIGPDGRLFVFGLSRDVAELLATLCPRDERLQRAVGAGCEPAAGPRRALTVGQPQHPTATDSEPGSP